MNWGGGKKSHISFIVLSTCFPEQALKKIVVKGTSGPKASGTSLSADPSDLPTKSKFSIKSLESSYQITLLEGIHSTQSSGSSVLTSGAWWPTRQA